MDETIRKFSQTVKEQNLDFEIKHIERNFLSFAVIDRKVCFTAELLDDTVNTLLKAICSIIITSSPPTVSFYVSVFESFWEQAELYERTKDELDNAKDDLTEMKDYVDIIAKELSTISKEKQA
jgi:hypothetical protein